MAEIKTKMVREGNEVTGTHGDYKINGSCCSVSSCQLAEDHIGPTTTECKMVLFNRKSPTLSTRS